MLDPHTGLFTTKLKAVPQYVSPSSHESKLDPETGFYELDPETGFCVDDDVSDISVDSIDALISAGVPGVKAVNSTVNAIAIHDAPKTTTYGIKSGKFRRLWTTEGT